jgi:hypothetical protein
MVLPALHGTTGRMKGLPTDNGYGLPGADLLATVAVGRLPARTVAEARGMIQKTLDQERDTRPGTWRRRLMVLAGAPEFNPLVDSLVERLAIAQLARIDLTWHGQALYQNPQSRFSLPADLCRERARAYLQQGQALTLYLGHSNAQGFFAGGHRYLDRHDWAELTIPRGRGILATFGCKGCQLSGPDGEGYGLAAIRNPQGPVAVIGSHGICFAAMVKLASEAFTESFLGHDPPQRLGACWLRLKHGLARRNMDSITFRLLDAVDGDSRIPQDRQRREHQEMFLLLGDPALRLPSLPPDLKLEVAAPTTSGNIIKVKGAAPARLEGARVCLTLERPLDSDPPGGTALPAGSPAARSLAMRERHERANRFILATQEAFIKQGRFEGHLALPAQLPWAYIVVRAYAATERQEGLGVLRKEVKTPEPDKGS